MTDQEILNEVQYALVEPVNGGASWASGRWSVAEVTRMLNDAQDDVLDRTGVVVTRPGPLTTVPNTPRHLLPQNWMATRRMVWRQVIDRPVVPSSNGELITLGLGTPGDVPHFILVGLGPSVDATRQARSIPLPKAGWNEVDASDQASGYTPRLAYPLVYLEPENLTPTLEVQVSPAVIDGGVLDPWIVARGELDNSGRALSVPDVCAPLVKYGLLQSMLTVAGRGGDPERAAYCQARFEEAIEVLQQSHLVEWR